MAENGKKTEQHSEAARLPIDWRYPEGQAAQYVNNMVAQFSERECFISFFSMKPPLLSIDTPEGQETVLDKPKAMIANCVAQIVVTEPFVRRIVEVLQGSLKKQEGKTAQVKPSDTP